MDNVKNVEFVSKEDALEEDVYKRQPCPCGSGKKFKNCHGRNR